MSYQCRLLSFKTKDVNKKFQIQMFAIDDKGKSYSIKVEGFKPFFYIKVGDGWGITQKRIFIKQIINIFRKEELSVIYKKKQKGVHVSGPPVKEDETEDEYISENIETWTGCWTEKGINKGACKIIKRKNLYGFDKGKEYIFIVLKFRDTSTFYRVKDLWYDYIPDRNELFGRRSILKKRRIMGINTELYEAKLPTLLRFFHIQEISPSGWVEINKDNIISDEECDTNCDYEFTVNYKHIEPLPKKETGIPVKVCSFDIEASSSHGDFPVPIKHYRKWVGDVLTYWTQNSAEINNMVTSEQKNLLLRMMRTAYGYDTIENINIVYPKWEKKNITKEIIDDKFAPFLRETLYKIIWTKRKKKKYNELEKKKYRSREEEDDDDIFNPLNYDNFVKKGLTLLDYLNDKKIDKTKKLEIMDEALEVVHQSRYNLIPLEGDKVTFIGSTFIKIGESIPYLNHGVCLGSCDPCEIENSKCEIECYKDEKELLLAWTKMIQREKPDVIIGYNIFGFDWKFMCERAEELNCFEKFVKLSRNNGYNCRKKNKSIRIASGTHNLTYVEIDGIIQIDLYNHFRKSVNLGSYKLQDVGSHYIGDMVKDIEIIENATLIKSGNLMGLQKGNYVCFELIGHSMSNYKNGKKFHVLEVNESEGTFKIDGHIELEEKTKLRWGLGKDDVSVQDLFHAFSKEGTKDDRTKVAYYCFQDCNLVHNLFRKNDIWTGMAEQAAICSIPIDYVVMRGQGIKLLSFIAKKCRQKRTLMPVIQKVDNDGSYEGAICLKPKRGFYGEDNPVAVVDYSSLYPSCMISENISHDSKVWTKEYDLDGKLLKVTGIRNKDGEFIYDNLDDYKYVNIEYDRYEWIAPPGKKKEEKIKVGTKICRFAQFPNDEKAIMPSILSGLLAARKATRVNSKYKTITTKDNKKYSGLLSEKDDTYVIVDIKLENEALKKEIKIIEKSSVVSIEETYSNFMKNVFNQRQASIKVVANSLYGQCGARTSAFYEKDIAASTTATGRKLLIYGQKVIEDVYGDSICDTKFGKVKTNAEYIYGDSVTPDTPLLLKNKETGTIEFKQIDDLTQLPWKDYRGFKVGEEDRYYKEQNIVDKYQIYTSNGWSDIKRVIRHKTVKQLYRVTTHTGMVDVTEDHSLLDENKKIIKPNKCKIGDTLLHNYPIFKKSNLKLLDLLDYIKNIGIKSIDEKEAFIYGFFFGDGSCARYECPSGLKYSWALNQKNIESCLMLQALCIEVFEDNFKIYDTIKSSGIYKISPACGDTKKYVEKFRKICYNKNKYKIIPVKFINGNNNIRLAYFAGYYMADGSKAPNEKAKSIRLDNKGKIGSAMLFYMAKSLGLNVSLNTRKDKLNIIRLNCTSGKQRKNPNIIKKIDKLGLSKEFVYDIETSVGDFNTGFALIAKNTDSVFFTFHLKTLDGKKITGKKGLQITIDLAIEAGKLASKFLKNPHDLEYEKTFMPFLLLSKKRYVGMLYENDVNYCKSKSMGIVLKRRDNANIVKDCYGGIINILMAGKSSTNAVNFTREFLKKMIDEKFPLDKLIISKSLRGFYKNPDSIAHRVLANRMGRRDPGTKPSIGSRVQYVYIQTKKKMKLQGDRIENPEFIIKNKLKPDFTFYITNQIQKPVTQVFALLLENIDEFKPKIGEMQRKINGLRRKHKNDIKKFEIEEIKCRNRYVKKLIFDSPIRQANNNKNGQRTISSFF